MLILIVDDDPHIRQFFQVNLRASGYATQEAGSVAEAWQLIQRQRPDLIIMDLHLKSERGEVLVKRIEQSFRGRIPVLVISGSAPDIDAIYRRVPGACDVLLKPITRTEFMSHVRYALHCCPMN